MNDKSERVILIFAEALHLPTAERPLYLERECAGDPEMKRRLEALLRAHDKAGDFLREPAPGLPKERSQPLSAEQNPGDMIGRYRLLQQIGEGGCGVVYMAEQEEPVRRQVALKIIKPGMDTKSVIARFEIERQVLALMDSPHIAKVFDAGATATGRPYFVMELIRGTKITEYCDQNSLTTDERLNLFIQVCQAIQHAHQKGIIHRDIKPSNILVTTSLEGIALPVVIDFGIAKATTNQRLTNKTLFTAFEMLVGTPAYMSPEQAALTGVDVDTRSDIYSLGVLLYEMLTSSTPFDSVALLKAGLDEIRRVIREQEPLSPSTRLSRLPQPDLTTIAQHRKSEPSALIRQVRGDLDWIVMKTLEKDRTRRYETANGLAADIQRFLADEPISARPPSKLYKFQKTVLRNKLLFAGTGVIVALLFVGLITVSTSLARERRSRREAESSRTFLESMLKGVGPSIAMGQDTKMLKGILDQTADRVGREMADQPVVEAQLRSLIGRVYFEIGSYDRAEEMHRAALAINRRLFGAESQEAATSLNDLGQALMKEGNSPEAEKVLNEALAVRRHLFGERNADVAVTENILSTVQRHLGKLPAAETLVREALATQRALFGDDSLEVANSLHNLSAIQGDEGKRAEAEATAREILAMRRRVLGNEHPLIAAAMLDVAGAEVFTGKLEDSEKLGREALAMQRRLLGDDHPDVSETLSTLGERVRWRGNLNESDSLLNAALSIQVKLLGENAPGSLSTMKRLATTLEAEGKWPEAEASRRTVLAGWRKQKGKDDPQTLYALRELASTLEREGKKAEAETVQREALAGWRKIKGDEDPQTLYTLHLLGLTLENEGKWSDAEPVWRETLAAWRKQKGDEDPQTLYALRDLALTLEAESKWPEAESAHREALAAWRKRAGNEDQQTLYTLNRLGLTLEAEGKLLESEQAHREVLAVWEKQNKKDSPPPWSELESLTRVLIAEKKIHDAKRLLDEMLTPAIVHQSSNVKLLSLRAEVAARCGLWPEAVTDASLAFEQDPSDIWRFPVFAALLVKTHNRPAYEKFCQRILTNFVNVTNFYAADQVAKSCLLLPSSQLDLKVIGRLADIAVTAGINDTNAMPYFQDGKAMAEYRQGHYQEAIEWAQKPLEISGLHMYGHSYAVLAMAYWQFGRKDEARAMLANAESWAPSVMPQQIAEDPSNAWHSWLFARIELDEANALIQAASTNQAESALQKEWE